MKVDPISKEWLDWVEKMAREDGADTVSIWWCDAGHYTASWKGNSLRDQHNERYEDDDDAPEFNENDFEFEFERKI